MRFLNDGSSCVFFVSFFLLIFYEWGEKCRMETFIERGWNNREGERNVDEGSCLKEADHIMSSVEFIGKQNIDIIRKHLSKVNFKKYLRENNSIGT